MLNEVKVLERQVFRPFKQEGARSDIVMVGNICVSHGLSVMIRLMSQKKDQSYQHFRWAQWTVRGSICVVAALLAMQVAGPAWLAALMPSLSVFTALLAVAAGGGGLLLSGALVMAVICVFKPRFFCRWVCPVGTCRDVLAGRFSHRAWVARVPQLGLWLVCVGVGAALMGYPLFGWLDPLVIFNAFFGTIGHAAEPRPWGAWVGLPMLLLLSVIGPWLWCGRLCPLGAMQDLLRSWTRFKSFAKGCGVNQQVPEKPSTASGRAAAWQTSRRVFLGLGLGAGYRLVLPPGDTSGPEPRCGHLLADPRHASRAYVCVVGIVCGRAPVVLSAGVEQRGVWLGCSRLRFILMVTTVRHLVRFVVQFVRRVRSHILRG